MIIRGDDFLDDKQKVNDLLLKLFIEREQAVSEERKTREGMRYWKNLYYGLQNRAEGTKVPMAPYKKGDVILGVEEEGVTA